MTSTCLRLVLVLLLLAACSIPATSPAPATAQLLPQLPRRHGSTGIHQSIAAAPRLTRDLRSSGTQTSSHGSAQLTWPLLPPCDLLLAELGHHTFDSLGHELQALQRHQRVQIDLEALLNAHRSGPPADPKEAYAWNYTWATNMTVPQLLEAMTTQNRLVTTLSSKLSAALTSKTQALLTDSLSTVPNKLRDALPAGSPVALLSSCMMYRLSTRLYVGHPEVSFLLQYYKRPWIVEQLVQAVQSCSADAAVPSELLVNVDNPSEHEEWAAMARSTEGFVVPVFSPNVHEARGYNRLASMARGRILVILQDDEVLDTTDGTKCAWLRNLVTVFDRFPAVGVVGLKSYIWAFGPNNTQAGVYFRDPATQIHVQYVLNADYAPMAIRKSAWQHVGQIDETMSEPGECGIFGDWELCTRMWMRGYQVMLMDPPPKRMDQGHDSGTHKPETAERCWGRQSRLASGLYWSRYGEWNEPLLRDLAQHAKQLNADHLEVLDRPVPSTPPENKQLQTSEFFRVTDSKAKFGGYCPYATGCTEFELAVKARSSSQGARDAGGG